MAWGGLGVAWTDFTIRESIKNHPGFGGWLDWAGWAALG